MVKTGLKKYSTLALAGVLSVGMLSGTLGISKVQAAEPTADQAQITVGKTLTIDGAKFPDIKNFTFELEAIEGYTNPNVSTAVDGQAIPAAQVPMPAGATNNKKQIDVGNFNTAATGDTASVRVRTAPFDNITYTTAGYYLYKLSEVGSKKTDASAAVTNVPGVTYDDTSYYVVVYVVNNKDATTNDTTTGVHVDSITAWHNANGSDANRPNLADIADTGGDNGGNAALDNNQMGVFGKVGKGTNKLDAYKFWNSQQMADVAITKNVKGNLGDKTKQFEFTVEVSGLEAGNTYAVTKTGAPSLVSATKGNVDNAASTFTADETGAATFLVKMTDDQGINLVDLPVGANYKVTEAASNHAPSFNLTVTGEGTGQNAPIIAKATDSKEKENALATAQEVINPSDGDATIAYTNTRNLETITGIPSMAIYFAAAGLFALLAFVAIRRRKDDTLTEM